MLVLGRTIAQSIIISVPGHALIRITVAAIRFDYVRLGVEATPDIRVDREEIWEKNQRSMHARK